MRMMRALLCVLLAASALADESENRRSKLPYIADAVGNTLPPPSNGPATVGSPVNLLTPDRYEFYTFDESGELVKRLMTLEEIQAIVAAGEETEGLVTFANENQPTIAFNFSQPPYTKVHSVVTNVQNVLKAQMEAHKNRPLTQPTLDTPDVSDSWSLILPSIFGNTGVDIVPDKTSVSFTTPETETIELDRPMDDNSLSKEGSHQILSSSGTTANAELQEIVTTQKISSTTPKVKVKQTTTTTTTTTTRKPTTTTSKPSTTTTTTTTAKPTTTTTKKPTAAKIQTTITSTTTTTSRPRTTTTTKPTTKIVITTPTPTTTTTKPTTKIIRTTPKPTTVKPISSTKKNPTTQKETETNFTKTQIQTLSNTILPSTEKSTIKYEKISTFVPISTASYVTERSTQKPVSTTRQPTVRTTKKYVPTTTKSLTTTTKLPTTTTKSPPTTTVKVQPSTTNTPLISTSAYMPSTQGDDVEKFNATTITTQSVSPSTTVSSTEFITVSSSSDVTDKKPEVNNVKQDEPALPLFDISQSISQIASDLGGNYRPLPTSSDLLDSTKLNDMNLESKENIEIDIPADSEKETEVEKIDDKNNATDNFVKISTIEPHPQNDNKLFTKHSITKTENRATTASASKMEVTTNVPITTTIDPVLSESMGDLLQQIVNQQPQKIVNPVKKPIKDDEGSTTETTRNPIKIDKPSKVEEITESVIKKEIETSTKVKENIMEQNSTKSVINSFKDEIKMNVDKKDESKKNENEKKYNSPKENKQDENKKVDNKNSEVKKEENMEQENKREDIKEEEKIKEEMSKDKINKESIEKEANSTEVKKEEEIEKKIIEKEEIKSKTKSSDKKPTEQKDKLEKINTDIKEEETAQNSAAQAEPENNTNFVKVADSLSNSNKKNTDQTKPTLQTSTGMPENIKSNYKVEIKNSSEVKKETKVKNENISNKDIVATVSTTTKTQNIDVTKKPIMYTKTENAQLNTNKIIPSNKEDATNNKDEKDEESLPKVDEFKKKIQKVNIDDKELANDRNNSWKLISTVSPPKANEIPKDKLKTDPQENTNNEDIVLYVSKENQGLEATTKDLSEDIAQFAELCNELAFRYWHAMTESIDKKRSFVLSPYSVTSMLAMMFMGARGATSGEMNEILKLDDMVTFNPHFTLKNISDSIETTADSGVIVSVFVRELFSDRSKGKILTFYKERAQHFYNGHVEEINFKLISDVIRRRTNLLVKRYTWGRIVEYMKANTITMQPPLAAFSANIFQTDCTGTSVDGRDGEMYFVVSPNVRQRRLVPVPAVVYKSGFLAGYDPVLDATAAALGNTNSIVSTLFLMPGQQGNIVHAEDLEALERRLLDSNPTTPVWNRLLRTLLPRMGLELQIPRFSHKSLFNVSTTLKKMGLKELFDADHADLGGLNGPSKDLYLSDMIQSTTFVTCGEGVIGEQHHIEEYPENLTPPQRRRTSRWATGWDEPRDYQRAFHDPHDVGDAMHLPLHLRPRQARLPARNAQPARLKFDRPFLYFVRHNPSGMILYVGRYNPRLLP